MMTGFAVPQCRNEGVLFSIFSNENEEIVSKCFQHAVEQIKAQTIRIWCLDITKLGSPPNFFGDLLFVSLAEFRHSLNLVVVTSPLPSDHAQRNFRIMTCVPSTFVVSFAEAMGEIEKMLQPKTTGKFT